MIGTIKQGMDANVYAEPNINSMIECVLPGGTRVEVDYRQDLGKFCIIYTSMGLKGFCMKKHVVIER